MPCFTDARGTFAKKSGHVSCLWVFFINFVRMRVFKHKYHDKT